MPKRKQKATATCPGTNKRIADFFRPLSESSKDDTSEPGSSSSGPLTKHTLPGSENVEYSSPQPIGHIGHSVRLDSGKPQHEDNACETPMPESSQPPQPSDDTDQPTTSERNSHLSPPPKQTAHACPSTSSADFDESTKSSSKEKLLRGCDAMCCSDIMRPYQPSEDKLLEKNKKTYVVQNKAKTRQCQASWFKQYCWLHLCLTTRRVYCFFCMRFKPKGDDCKTQIYFSERGFDNWKRAKERFESHEKSTSHKAAMRQAFGRDADKVDQQLNRQQKAVQLKRRHSLINQLKAIQFLLRQGLALRGHIDTDGNLFQLLRCLGEEDWLSNSKYVSPDVVNEQIQMMSHDILRSIIAEVKQAKYFSIMADETTDCANREQLVLCLRWVGDRYQVFEETVGLIQVPDTRANTILTVIKDALVRLTLDLADCRGQAYDGASNFQGHLTGVATQLQREFKSAMPVHCLAHCVNLCLQGAVRRVQALRDALDFAAEVIQLITASPKRQVLFENIKASKGEETTGIRPLCPTRWTVKATAMKSLIDNYDSLIETLETVARGYDEYARKANGLLALMQKFSTFFGLMLSFEVFSLTEILSKVLQGKDINCSGAANSAEITLKSLSGLRSEARFERFFQEVSTRAGELQLDPPSLPRRRKPPARLDDGADPHVFSDVAQFYRQQYFETIDCIQEELRRRFDQKTFGVIRSVEDLLVKSAMGEQVEIADTIKDLYAADIDFTKLSVELTMLSSVEFEGVLDISRVIEAFNTQSLLKKMMKETEKLLRIYLTVPVTSATAERTFSVLRRTKTYLRATMSQSRLNHCLLLHCHQSRTDFLNLPDLAKRFVEMNDRRKIYFGDC